MRTSGCARYRMPRPLGRPPTRPRTRIRTEINEWRFYRVVVWPDLFGRALLARHWVASAPKAASASIHDPGAALNALARIKRRHGDQDRPV